MHGTVRDVAKATAELSVLPGASERLKLFKADLLKPDGFKEAMQASQMNVPLSGRNPLAGRGGGREGGGSTAGAGPRALRARVVELLPTLPELPQGCTVVFHTASPYNLKAGYGEQARKRLLEPAVLGTEHVLSACASARRQAALNPGGKSAAHHGAPCAAPCPVQARSTRWRRSSAWC